MAIMIPNVIPDSASQSEKVIFETFKTIAQSRDWVVLHSILIDSKKIDFVIVIPALCSVICIKEVQGNDLRTAVSKAEEDMNALNERFATTYFASNSSLLLGHNVVSVDETPDDIGMKLTNYAYEICTPDVIEIISNWRYADNTEKYQDAQVQLDNLRSDLVSTGTTIARIFHNNLETGLPQLLHLTDDQLKVLQLVGCQLPSTVSAESSEQLNFESIEPKPRCVIDGAAGTGKTVLALELAKQRCEEGETVGLLCCNPYLSHRFESWAKTLTNDHGGKVLAGTPATLPFRAFEENSILKDKHQQRLTASPNLEGSLKLGYLDTGWPQFINDTIVDIERIMDRKVDATEQEGIFDYLIVDEAQNLSEQMFLSLMDKMLKGGLAHGKWIMFGDFTNQNLVFARLANKGTDVLRKFGHVSLDWHEHKLEINCRNTHEIASTVAKLVRIKTPPKSGVHGPLVQIEYFESKENLGEKLDALISDLKENRGFSSQQIILLTSTKHDGDESDKDKFYFDTNREYGGWELLNISEVKETTVPTDAERILHLSTPDPNTPIRYSDVYDFQGLESDAAILVLPVVTKIVGGRPIIPKFEHRRRLLYTGMSRAKAMLIILAQESYKKSLEPSGLS